MGLMQHLQKKKSFLPKMSLKCGNRYHITELALFYGAKFKCELGHYSK